MYARVLRVDRQFNPQQQLFEFVQPAKLHAKPTEPEPTLHKQYTHTFAKTTTYKTNSGINHKTSDSSHANSV